ncbi:MAG: extracellular solute-binding protein [Clostridia bacterium]|nr:extracellular solute-binding protein [Clostridia bacterium]
MKHTFPTLLLTAALLLGGLASCGDTPDAPADTSAGTAAPETASTDDKLICDPGLPAADFGGEKFIFAMRGTDGDYNDITAEATDGDALNDQIYYRNEYIETTYNIDIDVIWCGDGGGSPTGSEMYKMVSQMVMSGDSNMDVILTTPYCQSGLALNNYLLDMTELEHINLSQPWWDQNVNSMLSFYDRIYFSVGDITTIDNRSTAVLFFNKAMVEEYDISSPYDAVRDGTWTIDRMIADCKLVAADINGDSVRDGSDRWGFSFWTDAGYSLMHATGSTVGRINAKGEPEYCAMEEHFINSYNKIVELADKAYSFNEAVDDNPAGVNIFASGNGLYYWGLISNVIGMRSSEIEFGIIPLPKLDETQKSYYSNTNAYSTALVSVPTTVSDPSRAGLILEAYSARGMQEITPVFYDIQVMTKSLRDEDSAEMLELIFANQMYDIG